MTCAKCKSEGDTLESSDLSRPGRCTFCQRDLCGWCMVEGWDGEQSVFCSATCAKGIKPAPTQQELEALGQIRLEGM